MATRDDAAEILEIYNWYVCNRIATLQITPSTLPEYEAWVEDTLARAPLTLARDGSGPPLAYPRAHRDHPREAFPWPDERTISISPASSSPRVAAACDSPLLHRLSPPAYCTA